MPATRCAAPTGVPVAPAADSATMSGPSPRTASPVLPLQIPHDSGGIPHVCGLPGCHRGYPRPEISGAAKGVVMPQFTIPGLSARQGSEVAKLLQKQLSTYNDLHLTLKHVHWNVVGPNFIGVHEMIDPQVEKVRAYADESAERIATLGKSPQGTPGAIIKDRTWDDYSVGRDTAQAHLAALDLVYTGVIEDTRK